MEHLLNFVPILFIPFWMFGGWLSSVISGWGKLAEKYPDYDSSQAPWKGWRWGKFGWVDYKSCIWVSADMRGLHIKTGPLFLFRAFHPPICIPWSAIDRVEIRQILWVKVFVFRFDKVNVKVELEEGSLEPALPYLKEKLV
jgi:hypothetical protein